MVHLSFRAKQGLSIHETSHSSQQLPDVCHNISSIMCVAGQHHARVPRIPGHVRAGLLPATRDTAAHVAPYYQLQLPVSLASQVPPWTRPAGSQLLQHWREAETFQHSFTLALLQVCSSALVALFSQYCQDLLHPEVSRLSSAVVAVAKMAGDQGECWSCQRVFTKFRHHTMLLGHLNTVSRHGHEIGTLVCKVSNPTGSLGRQGAFSGHCESEVLLTALSDC